MKHQSYSLPFAAVAACCLAGCISTDQTVYREEDRAKVEFENDAAGRIFYETLSKLRGTHDRSESKTEVSLPVVFHHKRRVVEGESLAFNQAVRRCDTNCDARISELEARIFADAVAKGS
jgi:hypothetical protein